MTFTSQTATPSSGMPAKKAIAPATQSRIAMRWVKLERKTSRGDFFFALWMRFLPSSRCRAAACSWESPAWEVSSASKTLSRGRVWMVSTSAVIDSLNEWPTFLHGSSSSFAPVRGEPLCGPDVVRADASRAECYETYQ
jgi:hypothetical protein